MVRPTDMNDAAISRLIMTSSRASQDMRREMFHSLALRNGTTQIDTILNDANEQSIFLIARCVGRCHAFDKMIRRY